MMDKDDVSSQWSTDNVFNYEENQDMIDRLYSEKEAETTLANDLYENMENKYQKEMTEEEEAQLEEMLNYMVDEMVNDVILLDLGEIMYMYSDEPTEEEIITMEPTEEEMIAMGKLGEMMNQVIDIIMNPEILETEENNKLIEELSNLVNNELEGEINNEMKDKEERQNVSNEYINRLLYREAMEEVQENNAVEEIEEAQKVNEVNSNSIIFDTTNESTSPIFKNPEKLEEVNDVVLTTEEMNEYKKLSPSGILDEPKDDLKQEVAIDDKYYNARENLEYQDLKLAEEVSVQ